MGLNRSLRLRVVQELAFSTIYRRCSRNSLPGLRIGQLDDRRQGLLKCQRRGILLLKIDHPTHRLSAPPYCQRGERRSSGEERTDPVVLPRSSYPASGFHCNCFLQRLVST